MQLLVIRHAIAMEREDWARTSANDDERPLTRQGAEQMQLAAGGLRRLIPTISRLGTSPLVRAVRTAEIVTAEYRGLDYEITEALDPDAEPSLLTAWARQGPENGVTAIVGHEPHLGILVSWLLARRQVSFVELKKGGACLLEFDGLPSAGGATLRWLVTAGQLRKIA